MNTLTLLLGFAAGQSLPEEDNGPARRLQLGLIACLLTLAFAAIYGAAAGSSSLPLALGNVVKVPVVVLLATFGALPAGFLAWRLSGARISASDLLLSFGTAVFAATMVLAATSPLVALYYNTSAWAGPVLGLGTVGLALLVGGTLFVRGVVSRVEARARRRSVALPIITILVMVLATLVQLVALASPILPEVTVFDGGVDRIFGH